MSENPRRANVMLPQGSSWAMLFVSLLYVLVASVGYGAYGAYIGNEGSMLVSQGYLHMFDSPPKTDGQDCLLGCPWLRSAFRHCLGLDRPSLRRLHLVLC